jgi:hypothetical protein
MVFGNDLVTKLRRSIYQEKVGYPSPPRPTYGLRLQTLAAPSSASEGRGDRGLCGALTLAHSRYLHIYGEDVNQPQEDHSYRGSHHTDLLVPDDEPTFSIPRGDPVARQRRFCVQQRKQRYQVESCAPSSPPHSQAAVKSVEKWNRTPSLQPQMNPE